MTGIIRTNPALRRRLEAILTGQDEGAMLALFPTLSNSERRTASWLLGEELLPRLEGSETFMYWFDALTAADVRAHLGTCLKAAAMRLSRGTVDLADRRWDNFAARATAIDRRKTLDALLPLATDLTTADHLLKRFAADSIASTATACLRAATTPAPLPPLHYPANHRRRHRAHRAHLQSPAQVGPSPGLQDRQPRAQPLRP